MIKATLAVAVGNLLLDVTPKSLTVRTLRTDCATGELVAAGGPQLETCLTTYDQIRQAGLALVRFAELLS